MTEGFKNIQSGIVLSVVAFALFSVSDAARKYLSVEHDLLDIMFWQGVMGCTFLLCILSIARRCRLAL